MKLSLLVLRCSDLAKSKAFYEGLGLTFKDEQHGKGPKHLSTQIGDAVLELYPLDKNPTTGLRFGLTIPGVDSQVVKDPDGHTIEITKL